MALRADGKNDYELATFLSALLMLAAVKSGASVTYPKVPLLEAIAKADVVVHAKTRLDSNGQSMKCGTDYFIEVLETFKGRPASQRSFSVTGEPHGVINHTVNVGDEMLLLLQPRKVLERPEGGLVDVIQPPPSAAERTCLAKLSPWTLWFAEAGGFPLLTKPTSMTNQEAMKWLGYPRTRTALPPAVQSLQVPFNQNCKGEECESASRRKVPWLPLRAEILRSLSGST